MSLECELTKQYVVLKPLNTDSTKKDVYGFSIFNEQWYIFNSNNNELLPITIDKVWYDTDVNAGPQYRNRVSDYLADSLIRLDTVSVSNHPNTILSEIQNQYGVSKALIMVSGDKSALPKKGLHDMYTSISFILE